MPQPIAHELIEQGHAFAPFIRFARDPELLYEGSELDGWQVVDLPGHADGHIGFLRDGVLVGGDHLLARITPAVGLYPESRPDPLGDYLASLQRTIELAPRIVYPGHGEPIANAAERAREIVQHHHTRLDEVAAALSTDPRSGFAVSLDVFGASSRRSSAASPSRRRFRTSSAWCTRAAPGATGTPTRSPILRRDR